MIPEAVASSGIVDGELGLFEKANNQLFVLKQRGQLLLDQTTPLLLYRWVFTLAVVLLYVLRVWWIAGFHIVSYAVSIYGLNLFIGFLSPQVDPESDVLAEAEGGSLPTKQDDEFRPFIRQMPEFKFWFSLTRAMLLSILATFFPFLDVPVFWPVLLLYFIVLFTITMKKQIQHMIRHKYIPFTIGKPKHSGSRKPSSPISEPTK